MKQHAACVTTLLLTLLIVVDAFSGKSYFPFLQFSYEKKDHSRKSTVLKPVIYSWDENDTNEKNNGIVYWDEGEDEKKEKEVNLGYDDAKIIVEHLATDQGRVSSLARLAVAFSPPERRIDLKDIEQVEVLLVDGEHIEIVAAVRHEEACVRLLVPVQFPKSCGGVSNVEECVIDNLDMLDQSAGHRIEELSIESDMFDLCHDVSTTKDLPSWWIHPSNHELIQECDTIKRLLNEAEFQNEVKALAMRALNSSGGESPIILERVVVKDVGPSGLCFRARAENVLASKGKVILEVSYKFSSTTIEHADELRATVLGAVAEAST